MEIPNTFHFTAYYDDGEQYEQDFLDRSMQNPEKNAFFDIHYQPIKPIESLYAFRLTAVDGALIPEDCPRTIAVNLRTGQFEADGKVFDLYHGAIDGEGPLNDTRLLFFRVPEPQITMRVDGKGEVKEEGYTLGYILGWQANLPDGTNVKKFVSIRGTYKAVAGPASNG